MCPLQEDWMKITWCWVDGQKMMAITLTQHEANELYLGLSGESVVVSTVEQACFKFYEKGRV